MDDKAIARIAIMAVVLVAVVVLTLIVQNAFENYQNMTRGRVWVGQQCEPGSWVQR